MDSNTNELTFERQRGIVWVCDIKKSSMLLNDNSLVDDFEEYLKRFFWISRRIVEAANGKYIKWTGDGFLCWFPCELIRNKVSITDNVLSAAYHLSLLNNITQFSVNIKEHITLRHGLSFEEDALITYINSDDLKATDVLGRNIVLAFRLSSFEYVFPNITLNGNLVSENLKYYRNIKKISFSSEQIDQVFKGQLYQTQNIYNLDVLNKISERNLEETEDLLNLLNKDRNYKNDISNDFYVKFDDYLKKGPDWAKSISEKNNEAIQDLYDSVVKGYEILKRIKDKK